MLLAHNSERRVATLECVGGWVDIKFDYFSPRTQTRTGSVQ